MSRSPPLRFLVMVLGGWVAVRSAIVAPPWSTPAADAAAPAPHPAQAAPPARREVRPAYRPALAAVAAPPAPPPSGRLHSAPAVPLLPAVPATASRAPGVAVAAAISPLAPPPLLPSPDPVRAAGGRWSLSAWSFVRQGGAASLAAGGLLGGSQAGGRLAYRLNGDRIRPFALSARLSSPLENAAGAEAAVGFDWRPSRRVPVHLLVERRQALGEEGRSAFAITLYGGVSDAPVGPLRLDAYAQAGVVGARKRDLFGDGSVRLSLPIGRARLGAGAWSAAQPGVERVDVGPQASLRLPLAARSVTLDADWRLRIAGDARPGSGPTLTLATDF